MEEYTSSYFRANMAEIMNKVLNGFPVRIKAKGGIVLLKKEESNENEITNPMKPKVKGKIHGSLDDADRELKEYLGIEKKFS